MELLLLPMPSSPFAAPNQTKPDQARARDRAPPYLGGAASSPPTDRQPGSPIALAAGVGPEAAGVVGIGAKREKAWLDASFCSEPLAFASFALRLLVVAFFFCFRVGPGCRGACCAGAVLCCAGWRGLGCRGQAWTGRRHAPIMPRFPIPFAPSAAAHGPLWHV